MPGLKQIITALLACLVFTPATSCQLRSVRLWEVASGNLRREFRGHLARATCLAFSPDGQLLVSGSDDTTLLVWQTFAGK